MPAALQEHPDGAKRRRIHFPRIFDQPFDFVYRKPASEFDLFRMQCEGSLRFASIDPDELLSSCLTGINLKDRRQRFGQFPTQFLAKLPHGRPIVAFTGIEMARGG
jgi:hypothetical protein